MTCDVLLIDDDGDIRESVGLTLEVYGYRVRTAREGSEALTLLKAGLRPALIFLDLMMPVMDGWTFRAQQVMDPELAKLPVIVVSGTANVASHAAKLGLEGLSKPVDVDTLVATVERFSVPTRSRP